jgi:hypothetical protein
MFKTFLKSRPDLLEHFLHCLLFLQTFIMHASAQIYSAPQFEHFALDGCGHSPIGLRFSGLASIDAS